MYNMVIIHCVVELKFARRVKLSVITKKERKEKTGEMMNVLP